MAEYDGSVRINTKIDNDDFTKGIKEIITALRDIQKAITDMSANIQNAVSKINVSNVVTQVVKMETKVKSSTRNIGSSIEKLQNDLDSLYEKRGRLERGLFPDLGDELTEEQQKIAESNAQWSKYTSQINKASSSLDILSSKLNKDTAMQEKNTNAVKKSKAPWANLSKNIAKSIKNFKMSDTILGKMGKSFKKLGNMIKTAIFYYALFSVVQKVVDSTTALLKTNAQLVKSYAQVKGNLMTAFMPIYQAILPALQALMSYLVRATGYIAQFTNALFGQSIKASQNMAESLYTQATATDKVAKSTKEANKQLSAMDELNVITKPASPSATASDDVIAPTFNTIGLSDKVNGYIEALRKAFATGDFTAIGMALGMKLNDALNGIDWDKIKATAEKTAKSIATFLNGFIKATDWELVGKTIAEGINTAFVFAYKLFTTFDFQEFGEAIGKTINGFFKNVDWNLIGKTLSTGFSGIVTTIVTTLETLDWELVGKSIVKLLSGIDWIQLVIDLFDLITALDPMKIMSEIGIGIAKEIIAGFKKKVKEAKESDLVVGFKAKIATKWTDLKMNWYNLTVNIKDKTAEMKAKIATNVSAFRTNWNNLVKNIKPKTAEMKAKIATSAQSLKSNWNNLISNIKDKKISLSAKITTKAKDLKEDLLTLFKSPLKALQSLINSLIGAINSALTFKMPTIKNPITGDKIAGGQTIKLADLNKIDIPGLATGTVVPANYGNFLATLGDAKVPEIVSPIDMMAKTFDGVMQKYIGQLAGSGNITIKIGEREVFQVMREQARIYERQTNKKPW